MAGDRVSHISKEHLLNITIFTEMSKESDKRSCISMKLQDLNCGSVNLLLCFVASVKTGLSLVFGV
jgi:hypothetical protein